MKKAIQFGAGNIGRGFIGAVLEQAGYHVVFADVNAAVIDKINEDHCYTVHVMDVECVEQKITKLKSDKEAVLAQYAVGDKYVRQLIDITLLQNNMLTGEALNNFVKRSIELMQ